MYWGWASEGGHLGRVEGGQLGRVEGGQIGHVEGPYCLAHSRLKTSAIPLTNVTNGPQLRLSVWCAEFRQ